MSLASGAAAEVGFTLKPRPAIIVIYPHPTNAKKLRKRVIPLRDHADILRLSPAELALKLVRTTSPLLDGADGPQLEAVAGRLASQMRKLTNTSSALTDSINTGSKPGVLNKTTDAPVLERLSRDLLHEVEDMLSEDGDEEAAPVPPSATQKLGARAAPALSANAPPTASRAAKPFAFPDALDSLSTLTTRPLTSAKPHALNKGSGGPGVDRTADLAAESLDSAGSFDFGSPAAKGKGGFVKPAPKPSAAARGGGKADPLAALLGLSDSDSDENTVGSYGAAAARAGMGRGRG